MKHERKWIKHIICSFAFLLLISFCPVSVNASVKTISLKTSQLSTTSTKLSWSKKSGVKKYKIKAYYYSGTSKKSKTVTIKGSAKSYTFKKLKSGKDYYFELAAYNKKGKKIYYGTNWNYTGIAEPEFLLWEEEYGVSCSASPKTIILYFMAGMGSDYSHGGTGIAAKGVELYRKANGGSYKKIKTFTQSVNKRLYYIDSSVTTGETYSYKIRSYYLKKVKKHYVKCYSKYSHEQSFTAANYYGTYTLYTLTDLTKPTKELILKLDSDSQNRNCTFTSYSWQVKATAVGGKEASSYQLSKVSLDGVNWTDAQNTFSSQRGKSVYLKYTFDTEVNVDTYYEIEERDGMLSFILSNNTAGNTTKLKDYAY